MADDAIPRVVTRKMQHPHDFVVSANVINNPPLGFMHYHLGALHPYFPDVEAPADSTSDTSLVSWKPSQQRP